jgi:predicted cytidylate kinase
MQISITGMPGAGKTTAVKLLKNYGYEKYGKVGETLRAIAIERGITILELQKKLFDEPEIDLRLDAEMKKYSEENKGKKIIYDSRMAWFLVKDSLKVFLNANPKTIGERVMGDRELAEEVYENADDAAKKLLERRKTENERYKKLYGKDCNSDDLSNFDLVIDTDNLTPEEVVNIILEKVKTHKII